ncbi:hypothetical protein GZA08_07655 [Pseudoroseicyclus sp. CLL3-39]|uniref:Uncharacterized protein n=2 Tax=Pseudoroseicyclus tamaricis TaxID=2705421 RepID=A0A6B2JHS7_9RHOB|nr:hypothetical protein [Pseudoroseicyclus tamaricis]
MFAVNAIPHFVAGVQGRPFPSPFAKPPGRGLSRPMVNVGWGAANAVVAWLLLALPGPLDLTSPADALAFGLGALSMGLMLASWFGKVEDAG